MHWTAFLAYRRFPANARVIDDIACVQCGYNLRSQMVAARCPECGHEVGNSIFLLARPQVAARGLKTAAGTYLAPFIMLLFCINQAYWPLLVTSGVMVAACVFRLWGVIDLRFRAAIARLPVLGPRVSLWWVAVVLDLAMSLAWLTMTLIVANSTTLRAGAGYSILVWLMIGWWCCTTFSAWAAGRFGLALADMLGYSWTRIEFRAQQIAVLIAAGLFPFVAFGLSMASGKAAVFSLLVLLTLITLVPLLQTALGLAHSATAAEASAETWDDLIDSERVTLVPEASLPRQPEPPPISLE
jgi:hypothetical protein